jgi:hypothetical protein
MKKLLSVLFAAVFALTVSGFALAADNAAKAPKAEEQVEKTEKKVEKKTTTKKTTTKGTKSKKKTEKKEEVKEEATPAPVKK